MSDRQFLLLLRVVLVVFTLAALLFALNSKSTMYEMVQNAYKVTLVSCIVPLAAGIYWKRANDAGRRAVGGVRPGVLGHRRVVADGRHRAAAARRPRVLDRRHGARLARAAQRSAATAGPHVKH